jgi:hypothetical protein
VQGDGIVKILLGQPCLNRNRRRLQNFAAVGTDQVKAHDPLCGTGGVLRPFALAGKYKKTFTTLILFVIWRLDR